jgi:hypothetical protein
MVQSCYGKLEKGQFGSALQDIDTALHSLAAEKPQSFLKEIRMCVNYKFVLQLLLENKKSEGNLVRAAILTRILAGIVSFCFVFVFGFGLEHIRRFFGY